jgi:hypothetical protein
MPRPFYLDDRAPANHWIGECVVPIVGLDAVKKKIYCPWRESNPESSDIQPVDS